ncbi:MAG TPA: DNA polymerase/3'-5' exonuclease PolX [Candidatus Paceibacterota bacterium]|nr:DNA polymerase/3'-5' exonuclease PolX [Verrucomicrobiota bacterium]HSA12445.1 DNA polymerase/3'-5' exonuclease PolX [Candidatus Paceibacterota bacterium]
MDKDQVAEVLVNIGTLLELKGENPFKTRAYQNAARTIEALTEPLDKVVAEARLGELKGIGEALQQKITELVTTGRLKYYEDLKAATPPGLVAMLDIPGLGPKKIKALHDELGIESVEQLEQACKADRVAGIKGFGEKTQTNILEGIHRRRSYASRHLISEALSCAEPILEALRSHPDVIRCSTAGSLRRHREVIGDIDLLASSKRPAQVIAFFTSQPGVEKVLAKGETKASALLKGGIQSDLRVVSDAEYSSALMYFTGSKEHNIVMRQRAIDRGLRLNEYGLFRSTEETRDPKRLVKCRTEEEIFEQLGLHYVPPELREDMGEIAAAERGSFPRLIEWTDLKGSLHNHSTWSDGHQRPVEIAAAMRELGLAYWGITDHSKSSFQANGLDTGRVRQQLKEIAAINAQLAQEGSDFRLLAGAEVDILKDGALDFPDDLLAELDVVIASVHQSFNQTEAQITRRLIGAARNPYVHILGHLTGRLLLEREAYAVDQRAVIDACAETGTWIELNSHPMRLDLDWRLWPYAKSKGVRCAINCDGHRLEHAGFLRLGAGIARKGWLTRDDVVNTLPLKSLRQELGRKRTKAR